MNEQLQQSVENAVNSQASAASVSVLTLGSGLSTAFQVLPVAVGVLTSMAGLILSLILIRKAYYSTKLIKAQIDSIKNGKLDGE